MKSSNIKKQASVKSKKVPLPETALKRYLSSWGMYILVIIPALCLFWGTLYFGFVNHDDNIIILNKVYSGNFFRDLIESLSTPYLTYYFRPFIGLSLFFDYTIGGTAPWMYHFTNLLIHLLSAVLLYHTLLSLDVRKGIACSMSILFSIHPIIVQSEAWIPGRNDLLAGLWILISFNALLYALKNGKTIYLFLHLLSFFFALTAKETSLGFIIVGLYYITYVKHYPLWGNRSIQIISGWGIVLVLWGLAHNAVLKGVNIPQPSGSPIQAFLYNLPLLLNAPFKMLVPLRLAPYEIYSNHITIIVICSIVSLLVWTKMRRPEIKSEIFLGIVWMFAFLIPAMFIRVDAFEQKYDYLECRMYLPLLGILIFLANLVNKQSDNVNYKYAGVSAVTILAVVYPFISYSYLPVYEDPISYWGRIIEMYPTRSDGYAQLGWTKFMEEDYTSALQFYHKAIKMFPQNADYHTNISLCYSQLGEQETAKEELGKAKLLQPTNTAIYCNLGMVAMRQKDTTAAINYLRTALMYDSKLAPALSSLSEIYCDKRNLDSALFFAKKITEVGEQLEDIIKMKIAALIQEQNRLQYNGIQ